MKDLTVVNDTTAIHVHNRRLKKHFNRLTIMLLLYLFTRAFYAFHCVRAFGKRQEKGKQQNEKIFLQLLF